MIASSSPPRMPPRIRSAPRIRQVYWCDFPDDAQLPEFWKRRPVLIFSKRSTLHGKVTVLPFTTKSQPDNPHAYSVISPLDGQRAWVICDYLTTMAVSRLHIPNKTAPRLEQDDFDRIVTLTLQGLPTSNG